MDKLWSPWRSQYISSFSTEKGSNPASCFLCDAVNADHSNDQHNLVVYRAEHCFAIMNRYPYNAGHLMIVPNQHLGNFSDLDSAIAGELMSVTQRGCRVLTELYKPHGFNVGANLGRVAGAGIPD